VEKEKGLTREVGKERRERREERGGSAGLYLLPSRFLHFPAFDGSWNKRRGKGPKKERQKEEKKEEKEEKGGGQDRLSIQATPSLVRYPPLTAEWVAQGKKGMEKRGQGRGKKKRKKGEKDTRAFNIRSTDRLLLYLLFIFSRVIPPHRDKVKKERAMEKENLEKKKRKKEKERKGGGSTLHSSPRSILSYPFSAPERVGGRGVRKGEKR